MNVGVFLDYKDDDLATMALILAGRLSNKQFTISMATCAPKVGHIHPDWDRRCIKLNEDTAKMWCRQQDTIVTTHPCFFLKGAFSAPKIPIIRMFQCDKLMEFYNKKTRPIADRLVIPSQTFDSVLREQLHIRNSMFIPWTAGLPITQKSQQNELDLVRVLVPIGSDNATRITLDALTIFTKLAKEHPKIKITVAYSRTCAPYSRKLLDTIAKQSQGRIVLSFQDSWSSRTLLYGKHDLTLLPFLCDGAGLSALMSLAMGTPVAAFNMAPLNELIKDRENGILATCSIKHDKLGFPTVMPNMQIFDERVSVLLEDTSLLMGMAHTTGETIKERDSHFDYKWGKLLARS